ncbi:MAG: barstar family protein [Anaerolineae bacterium]|nr:barstar family protein [Anaerolineae bacterium]
MAAFTADEINKNWQLFDLFQNGGVVLFKRKDFLHEINRQFRKADYRVCDVKCSEYPDQGAMLIGILDALNIPRYPHVNLDGFNDFLYQINFNNCTGIVLILTNFHSFYNSNWKVAFQILDILAQNHRSHLLKGNRLLTIVQSDDPELDQKIGLVGGYLPIWNTFEWLKKDRGL